MVTSHRSERIHPHTPPAAGWSTPTKAPHTTLTSLALHEERARTARKSIRRWREGAAAAAAARRRGRGSRGPPRLLVLQEVMLEQHQPQPRRASARSHARGGRSGSAQARQPAAAEAPDTHTRCVSWGWVSRGGMIMAVVQARARWRLTSVVGCHRVDQESTGAARAPIAPRHIFAGVHFGGSRMRRPRSCTCGMLHCFAGVLPSGYVQRGLSPDSPAAG